MATTAQQYFLVQKFQRNNIGEEEEKDTTKRGDFKANNYSSKKRKKLCGFGEE